MERSVPWWRRVLEFALGGMRSGWGLFRRNGTTESAAETIPEVGITEGRVDQAENEIPVKQIPPQNEEVAADIEQAAEVGPAEEPRPVAQPAAAAEVDPVQADVAERTDDLVAAEEQAQEDSAEQTVEFVAAKQQIQELQIEKQHVEDQQIQTEAASPAEEPAAIEPDHAPEETTPAKLVEETAVILSSESAPATEAEPESTALAQASPVEAIPAQDKPAQEAKAQEPAPKLPFAPQQKHERTTAEKVAAALKARGADAEQSPFSVNVSQVYDGPLDLLLDLIRKQDIDIYDIPIAKITAQFLAYVDRLKASDMDVAGEFIYTAALLIHIKSKMLLPRAPAGPEDAAEDPRRELVERLLEHERFKNAAQMLHEKQMLEAATWTNPGVREFRETEGSDADIGPEIAADTTDLVRVFSNILERARNRPVLDVQDDTVTVGQMIQFLARRLTMEDKPVALRRLLTHTRSERALIAMFLALLEMVRLQAILLRQDRHFSEIFIKKHTGFEAAMNQGLANARDDWR